LISSHFSSSDEAAGDLQDPFSTVGFLLRGDKNNTVGRGLSEISPPTEQPRDISIRLGGGMGRTIPLHLWIMEGFSTRIQTAGISGGALATSPVERLCTMLALTK
jgi:hypothetical protein